MNFVTYGVGAGYQINPNLAILGGFEAYTTKRLLPPDEVEEGQPTSAWNTLLPLHATAVYRPTGKGLETQTFRPFFGGGLQLIPGYVNEGGEGALAFGLRAVGGADYGITDTFAVHMSLGTGFWAGSSWYLIEGLMNTGFVLQTNLGAMMVF
jgi:hypothetical protein